MFMASPNDLIMLMASPNDLTMLQGNFIMAHGVNEHLHQSCST